MSLIIEALKRARDDAVRRQAAARGLPLASIPRIKGRSPWLAIAVVPLAAALVICVLLLIGLYSRLPEPTQPLPAPVSTVETEGEPVAGQVVELPKLSADSASPEPAIDTSESAAVRPAQTLPSDRAEDTSVARSIDSPVLPSPARESPPATESTQASDGAERVFVGQARLPDDQVIDIGGIAWSESDPYALLNGQVIGVGERIRGYKVVEITRSQVVLEQDDRRIVLRLE